MAGARGVDAKRSQAAPARQAAVLRERALGDRSLDQVLDPQHATVGIDVDAPAPDEELAAVVQAHLGNDLVQHALDGSLSGGLGSLVLADFAMASVGAGGSPLASGANSAMLAAMRHATLGGDEQGGAAPALVQRAVQRSGRGLPRDLQARLESAFGISLHSVRVHDDAPAHAAAEGVQAHAFTLGTDIFFGRGEYQPGTHRGQELLAHEVTHAVQHLENRAGRATAVEDGMPVTRPSDAVEVEAYDFGRRFAEGEVGVEAPAELPGPSGAEVAPSQGDTLAREATPAHAPANRPPSGPPTGGPTDAGDQDATPREPSAEELAAMDSGEAGIRAGTQRAENAPPVDARSLSPVAPPTRPGGAPGVANVPVRGPGTPQLAADGPTPGVPSVGPARDHGVVGAYMDQHGPQSHSGADEAHEVENAAWGIAVEAFGSLAGYNKERGGFSPSNFVGIGSSIDSVLAAAKGADRGQGAMADSIRVVDTMRAVAEGVSTVSAGISMVCAILSLIGLIPPLAPVGAALLAVSQVTGTIAVWADLVAVCLAAVTSVLSAIQLVEAVKEGSPEVAKLYQNYQQDCMALVADGIIYGLDRFFGWMETKTPRTEGARHGMDGLANVQRAADGRAARGAAYQGLKSMGEATPGLLSARGTTAAMLTGSLRRQVAIGVVGRIAQQGAFKIADGTSRLALKADTKKRTGGIAQAARIQAALASASQPVGDPSAGGAQRLRALVPELKVNAPVAIPEPLFAPNQLDAIAQRRAGLADARAHLADQRDLANQGVAAGEGLLGAAREHGAHGQAMQAQAAGHQGGLDAHAQQAQQGQQQAAQGAQQTGRMGQSTQGVQAEAQQKQARIAGTRMPERPKAAGFWDRVANWFKEKIFDKVSAALGKVRDFVANLILKAVAFLAGVDDIDAKLAAARSDFQVAGQTTAQSQQQNRQVQADAQAVQQQAQQGTADAQRTIAENQASLAQVQAQDQALAAEDQRLAAEAATIEGYVTDYEAQWGPTITGEGQGQSEQVLDAAAAEAYAGQVDAMAGGFDRDSAAATATAAQAREAILADALAAGAGETALGQLVAPLERIVGAWGDAAAQHRAAIGGFSAQARGLAGQPLQQGIAGLDALIGQVSAAVSDAYADLGSFRRGIAEYLASVQAALAENVAAPTPGPISRKAEAGAERGAEAVAPGGNGQALPAGLAGAMGAGAAGVRVHADAGAAEFAASIGARAATVGRDIYFNAGEYDPSSKAGIELLAHEVHHAVAGGGGPGISQPGDSHELAADRFAADFVAGEASPVAVGAVSEGAISRKEEAPGAPAPAVEAPVEGGGAEGQEEEGPPPGTDVDVLLDEGFEVGDGSRGDKPAEEGEPVAEVEGAVAPPDRQGPGEAPKLKDGGAKGVGGNAPGVTPAQAEGQAAAQFQAPNAVPVQGGPATATAGKASPEVIAAVERVKGTADKEKAGIAAEGETQKAGVRQAGAAQEAAVQSAVSTLVGNISGDFAALAQAVQARGEAALGNLARQRDGQKESIRAGADAEIARMRQHVTERRNTLSALGQQLSADAIAHGQKEAQRAIQLAQKEAERAQAVGEAKAATWAKAEEATEIRATARKMARETASEIVKQGAEVAKQCIADGQALGKKLTEDTAKALENFGEGIEPAVEAVTQARDKALASCDQSYEDAAAQVSKATADALAGVESGKAAAILQAQGLADQVLPAIRNAVDQACTTIDAAVAKAQAELDGAVAQVIAAAGGVHESRAAEAVQVLAEVEASIVETGAGARGGLAQVGAGAAEQVGMAGGESAAAVAASGESIVAQNAQVAAGFDGSMSQIETATAEAFAKAGTEAGGKMKEASDAFLAKVDEAYAESEGKLKQTSADGKGEITTKVNEVSAKWAESVGKLGTEIDAKAHEIENASWWDKLKSAVGGFFKGFFSQLWNWVKDILLVLAIIVIALVILVAVIAILVAIFPGLLGPLLAGLIFLAVWGPTILAVIGYIGLAIGVVMAAISIYQSWKAWNNPNLTWEEKWEQTGRTTWDIIDVIGPEKALKPIAGIFKGARGVESLSDAAKVDDVADAAKLGHVDDVAKVDDAKHLGGAGKLDDAKRLDDAKHVDDAGKLDDAKKLDAAKPQPPVATGHGPSGKRWDDPALTRDEFIGDYRARYPDSSLTDAQLASRFDEGKRLNPDTGRLKTPEVKNPAAATGTGKVETPANLGPSGKRWDDPRLTKEEFIGDYRSRYPKSSLSDAELAARFDEGKRLNPDTGRLKSPDPRAKVDDGKKVVDTPDPVDPAKLSDPMAGAPKRVDVPKSPNNAEDILKGNADSLAKSEEAQQRLARAVQETNAKMQKAAEDIAKEIGVEVPQTGIKGNKPGGPIDQDRLIAGVLEKNARNKYENVGKMQDRTRGRFEVDSAGEVEAVARKLVEKFSHEYGTDSIKWKKPSGDYPRHHVIVTDPATGIAHEWQIGTKATTKFIEGMEVPLPSGVHLHARPDFHVVKYDVLDKLHKPDVRAKLGLPDDIADKVGLKRLEEDYNRLFRETGTTTKGQPMPKDFEARQKDLAQRMGAILEKLEADYPGVVGKLDTKGGGAAAPKGAAGHAGTHGATHADGGHHHGAGHAAHEAKEVAEVPARVGHVQHQLHDIHEQDERDKKYGALDRGEAPAHDGGGSHGH